MPYSTLFTANNLPEWLSAWLRDLAAESRAQSYRQYEPYQGQRLADVPEDILEAHKIGRESVGVDLPYYQEAQKSLDLANAPFYDNYQKYMSPYLDAVVDNIGKQGMRTFDEQILPRLRAEFVGSGHLGGSRYQGSVERAARDMEGEILKRQQEALMAGYNQAGQLFNADRQKNLEVGREMAGLGGSTRASKLADIAMLNEQGKYQQLQDQTSKDIGYQDWTNQRNHPFEVLGKHAAILQGLPMQQNTQTFMQTPGTPQVNTLGNLGALAGNIYGARLAMKKQGGAVRQKKKFLDYLAGC